MANLKISALTDGVTPGPNDDWVVAREGANYKITGVMNQFLTTTSTPTFQALNLSGSITSTNSGDNLFQASTSKTTIYGTNNGVGINGRVAALIIKGSMGRNCGIFFDDSSNVNYWLIGREYAGGGANLNLEFRYQGTRIAYFEGSTTGDLNLANDLNVTGNVNVTTNLNVTGTAGITGNTTITGTIAASNLGSGQYIATNLGTSGPISSVITDRIVWSRCKDVVTFAGSVLINTSAASGTAIVYLNLPVSTTMPDSSYLRGSTTFQDPTQYSGVTLVRMYGDTTRLEIDITKSTTSAVTYNVLFSGTYQIV